MKAKTFKIYIKSLTWMRDIHQLFDYKQKESNRQIFEIDSPSFINRLNHTISISSDPCLNSLIEIHPDQPNYRVISCSPLWAVIRKSDLESGQSRLYHGCVIKLGNLQYQIITSENSIIAFNTSRIKNTNLICRICFTEDDPQDPLISVCKCDEPNQYIHVECLQNLILSKRSPVDKNPKVKFLNSIYCELCKQKLPYLVKVDGVEFDMLKRLRPNGPFLILEGLLTENREPGVYFIGFKGSDTVMIGRSADSEVCIQDISISRCHARLKFDGKHFFIEDNSSKFGTLIQVESPLVTNELRVFQCGQTVLEISTIAPVTEELYWESYH